MNMTQSPNNTRQKGFTLVELLIVIAILGVLAGVVLVAINPLEQIARAQDAGRISAIGQLGRATLNYQTSQQLSDYTQLAGSASTWQTILVNSGEVKQQVSVTAATSNCANKLMGGICFNVPVGDASAQIWTVLTSKNEWTRAGCSGTQVGVVVWDSTQGKTGVGCVATSGTVPPAGISLK